MAEGDSELTEVVRRNIRALAAVQREAERNKPRRDRLAEHEVTRLVQLVDAIALHLHVRADKPEHFDELKRDVEPEQVLRDLDQAQAEADRR